MSILYLVIPISILIVLILICAIMFLIGDDEIPIESPRPSSEHTIKIGGDWIITGQQQTEEQTITNKKSLVPYTNYNLHRWLQMIQHYYWKADKRVRDILREKGWNWS